MSDNDNFEFTFKGEVLPQQNVDVVIKKLADMFNVSVAEISPLFKGKVQFQRLDLNKVTAQQYLEKFRDIGARSHVCEMKRLDHYPNQSTDQSTVKIISDSTNVIEGNDRNNHGKQGAQIVHMAKAVSIFKYFAFYILILITIDSYQQNNREMLLYTLNLDLDFGIWPYIIGNIALAYGCYHMAIAKGRSGRWGVLGLASLPGLSILLLLAPKNSPTTANPDIRLKLFALSMLFLSIYWVIGVGQQNSNVSSYLATAITLRDLRHEYPIKVLDSSPELLDTEIVELNKYLQQGFDLLDGDDFSAKSIKHIAETMFAEATRLFVWVNYQQFLHFRNGQKGPEFLNIDNIRGIKSNFFLRLQNNIDQSNDAVLRRTFQEWFYGYNTAQLISKGLRDFNQELVQSKVGLYQMTLYSADKFSEPYFTFDDVDLPSFSNITLKADQDIISYDLSIFDFPGSNNKLVIAYYFKKREKFSSRLRRIPNDYQLVQAQISASFPNHYLNSTFSIFDSVVITDNMR